MVCPLLSCEIFSRSNRLDQKAIPAKVRSVIAHTSAPIYLFTEGTIGDRPRFFITPSHADLNIVVCPRLPDL